MSKRGAGANFGGDEERYGGYSNSASMDASDKPTKATAAQLARRKIAQARKPTSRGASPAVIPAQQQQTATFSNAFDFQFGAPATEKENGFKFGASTPAPTAMFGSKPASPSLPPGTGLFGSSTAPFDPPKGNGSVFDGIKNAPQRATNVIFGSSANNEVDMDMSGSNGFGQNGAASSPQPSFFPKPSATPATPSSSIFTAKTAAAPSTFGSTAPAQQSFFKQPSATPADPSSGQNGTASPQTSFFSKPSAAPPASSSSIFAATTTAAPSSTFGSTVRPSFFSQPAASLSGQNGAASPQPSFFSKPPAPPAAPLSGLNAMVASSPQPSLFSKPSATPAAPLSGQNAAASSPQPSIFPKPSATPAAPLSGLNATAASTPQPSFFSKPPAPPAAPLSGLNAVETSLETSLESSPQHSIFSKPPAPPAGPLSGQNGVASSTQPSFFPKPSATPAPTLSGQNAVESSVESTPQPLIFSKPPATSAVPLSGVVAEKPSQPRSLFDRMEPADQAKVLALKPEPAPFSQPPQISTETPKPTENPTVSREHQRLRDLNEGLLSHLQSQKVNQDWTPILKYYMEQAAGITQASKAPATVKFNVQTPKRPDAAGPVKPPATAPPATKKRIFEEDDDDDEPPRAPASEKRSKPNEPSTYPKLPETASSAAKLFESSLDKSKSSSDSPPAATGGFNPSTKPMFPTSTNKTTPAVASPPVFQPPKFTAPASGNSFLSAFGQKAQAEDEKERKKRKAEDYDSDDETPEEWEKRDREEQQAKRAKLIEAGKSGGGFKFVAPATTSPKKPVTAKEVEKAQGPGDNTWKPETPIKFGASTADTSTTPAVAPPSFSLSAASSSTESGKLGPPSTGLSFGSKVASLDTSRATTPGVTTDGEASNTADAEGNADGEPSDEQKDAQIDTDDMTALMAVEREENEILMELKKMTSKKLIPAESPDKKPTWEIMGNGRAYLLKNKSTGKIRILQKVGLNQLALNFESVKGMKYALYPKKDTMISASFVDHIHFQPPKLANIFLTTETADEAKELARILTEGATQ